MALMVPDNLMVFTGNANPKLAQAVAQQINIPLGKAQVSRFSDGEVTVELFENVRGKDVFILQPTCAPTNDNLMEIMIMADALKRASAGRITAAIPYFGYARQDRRPRSARVAISAKVVANMLQVAGINRMLVMDLHADQIQGFFDIPVDNIYRESDPAGRPVEAQLRQPGRGVARRRRRRACTRTRKADGSRSCDHRQTTAACERALKSLHIIGEVEGRNCVIMDDMVDTANTLCQAAQALRDSGRCA